MIRFEVFGLLCLFSPLAVLESDGGWEKKYSIKQSWKEEQFADLLRLNGQQDESKEAGFYAEADPSEDIRVKRAFEGSATTISTVSPTMSTTPPPCIVFKISTVIKRLKFVADLLHKFSVPYTKLVKAILEVITRVLEAIKAYKEAGVTQFRRGSVIMDMEITFYMTEDTPKESEVQQIVNDAIQSATFTIEASTTAMTVTDTTIGATDTSTTATNTGKTHTITATAIYTTEKTTFASVKVGTTTPLTAPTTESRLTKGYNDTVTFKVIITIDEPYDSILSDHESAEFQKMANRFVAFLEPICKNASGCSEIVVNSFSEGSIVADIDVIFAITETTPKAQMIEGYIIKAKDDGLAPFNIQSLRVTEKDQEKADEKVEWWKVALIAGFGVMTFMVFSSVLIFALRQRKKRTKHSGYNLDSRRNSFELDYSFFSYDVGKTD